MTEPSPSGPEPAATAASGCPGPSLPGHPAAAAPPPDLSPPDPFPPGSSPSTGPSLQRQPDLQGKLAILADAAKYDASCASSGVEKTGKKGQLGSSSGVGICHSYTPDGRCISLLKVLLTNYCIYDCVFCVNRISSETPRARFRVEEIVDLTLAFYRRNYIEGLFLSSGIIQSPDYTMEQLTAVARSLRLDHGFHGYIHLKAVPGAAEELIAEAGRWADRLSANIELPRQEDLDRFAPEKRVATIETTMGQIRDRREAAREERRQRGRSGEGGRGSRSAAPSRKTGEAKPPPFAAAGQSTQMVVGASATPDVEILATADRLYRRHRLKRVYYSAFSPIPHGDGRLPAQAPPMRRENRLYQADWLLRFYGFTVDELVPGADGNLALDLDPKTAWALVHRDFFPLDVNRAPLAALLRVPGIGVRSARRIVKIRRHHRLTVADLEKLRIPVQRALPFVVTADRNRSVLDLDRLDLRSRLAAPTTEQLSLDLSPAGSPPPTASLPEDLDLARSAVSGEL